MHQLNDSSIGNMFTGEDMDPRGGKRFRRGSAEDMPQSANQSLVLVFRLPPLAGCSSQSSSLRFFHPRLEHTSCDMFV